MKIVEVHLDHNNPKLSNLFTYRVENEDYDLIKKGSEVIVDFNSQLKKAVVLRKREMDYSEYNLKYIIELHNPSPLNDYQEALFEFVDEKYHAPFIIKNNLFVLKGNRFKITRENDKILIDYNIKNTKELFVEYVQGSDDVTQRQLEVLRYVKKENSVLLKDLKNDLNVSDSVINKLEELGLVNKKFRDKVFKNNFKLEVTKDILLNKEQEFALQEIKDTSKPSLLYGVTSSGKTEIYIKYIKHLLKQDCTAQVLFLVPSTTLAIQQITKLNNDFDRLIIFHDNLTDGEKVAYFNQIKNNKVKVVVGTRESMFLPFKNLKCVVVDEEHDSAYFKRSPVLYKVNDFINHFYANDIKVILGSATPSITTMLKAQKNIYKLSTLSKRYNDYKMPEIKYVKTNDVISSELDELIVSNKNRQQPSVIFFNRQGYSSTVECKQCFFVKKCPVCNNNMTFHKNKNRYICKFCGTNKPFSNTCENCNSNELSFHGMGIEQFVQILSDKYKDLNIQVLDNIKGSNSSQKIFQMLNDFRNNKIDILVGSRTLSKGIDFLNISNLYVKNIDALLFSNEYKCNEFTYQLLEQVAGRAGRGHNYSEVHIETNHEEHFVYRCLKEHSYVKFYNEELIFRKANNLPPFYNVAKLELSHENLKFIENILSDIRKELKNNNIKSSKITEPTVSYRYNKNIRYILIKYKREPINIFINKFKARLSKNGVVTTLDMNMEEVGK